MTELLLVVLVAGVLFVHVRASERWEAERARLVSALTAPTPIAAHAALASSAAKADVAGDGEPVAPRRTPIGAG